MKKLFVLLVLMMIAAAFGFASEEVDVYEYLYNNTPTHSAQLDLLQNMAEARLSDAGEFYARALRKLVAEYKNIRNITEKNAADEQAMLLSALLGAEKYTDAASDLWLVVDGFTLPLVKAEALMALGKIRAMEYLPQVVRVLESLNSAPPQDRLSGERIAFGAIIALEKYQDETGYLPVFFASNGWYTERIKSQAAKSLSVISEDPSKFMLEIVQRPGYDYTVKYAALRAIEATDVDNSSKAEIAVAAYGEGWKSASPDMRMRTALADMRKLAIDMIRRYKTDDEKVYPLLERSYTQGFDMQEKLYSLAALASLKSEESARRLTKFLMDLNSKRQAGNFRQEDEQLIRAVIPALGQTGRSSGRPVLNAIVSSSYWTPVIKKLAEDALKQIK